MLCGDKQLHIRCKCARSGGDLLVIPLINTCGAHYPGEWERCIEGRVKGSYEVDYGFETTDNMF